MKIIGIVLITITILAIIILIKKKRKEKAKRKYIAVETTSFKKEKRQKLKDPIEETNYFKKILPNENTIYYGDIKNLPYGNKTQEELVGYAKNILAISKGCKPIFRVGAGCGGLPLIA